MAASLLLVAGCATTTHPVQVAALGKSVSAVAMEHEIDTPGPIQLDSVVSATWSVPLSGLLNLDDPQTKGMANRDEPIVVYAHLLRHPKYGNFLVDTGVSSEFVNHPENWGVSWLLQKVMKFDRMKIQRPTADIIAGLGPQGLSGVFFTHLHIDHISGMPDIGPQVPLYVGPGEPTSTYYLYAFTQGTTNSLLAGKASLQELPFAAPTASTQEDRFGSVLDVFGDGSLFAIHTPGHTAGSTAYLVRSTNGPVLLIGDNSHTLWGWEHGVEPGSYTLNQLQNRESLSKLKALVARHPEMLVRLGHQ